MGNRGVGQFRATDRCPICQEPNGDSNWTCESCTQVVATHRELLRNLQQWRSLHEVGDIADVIVNGGHEYSMWDLVTFYGHRFSLPDRQQLSIQFCLYENMKERDAAVRMGIKPSNPVSVYATIGLTSLLTRALAGDLPGYVIEPRETLCV